MIRTLALNSLHVLGFFLAIFLITLIVEFEGSITSEYFINSIIEVLTLIVFYGYPFIIGFLIYMIITDLILIYILKLRLIISLSIQWVLIGIPFIFFMFKYEYYLWGILLAVLVLTQFVRYKKIRIIQ